MGNNFKDGDKVAIDFYSYGEPLCTAFGVVDCGGEYISVVDGMIPTDPSKIYTTRITPCPDLPVKQETKWTSVKEKQPDYDGDYWATVKRKAVDGWNDEIVVTSMRFKNGTWLSKSAGLTGYHCEEVLAWQPLPEPYQAPELPFNDRGIDDHSF